MTSTNDGKDVKSNLIFGQKAKTYYIELYKTLEARLSVESELGARTSLLCEAWRRVHCLCQHSATSTHPHLISWLQRHTAQTILQSEWRQLSINRDKHEALVAAIDFFILECQEAIITRRGPNPQWETQLLQRAEWFKTVIPDPWGNAVLKALLDPSGEVPSDKQIVEWLKEERGVFFVTRLRQLASSKKTVDIALSLATAVMERVRACAVPVSDTDSANNAFSAHPAEQTTTPTFTDVLTMEAGFTIDVWELITDIEFVLLYSDRSKCIALAKKTPLKIGYQLVERLHCRLDVSSREKRLWKNAKDVAILIAQVMVARCMVVPTCVGTARSTLYGCSRSLVKLLPAERLPASMAALAAPAATARHLHTLAVAVDAQCKNERKPFVCELYIRAITAGMNELERLKLNKEKEAEARTAEKLLGSWFTSLGSLLGTSARLAYECALTAFSLHPSATMYERICSAPQLQPAPVHKEIQEPTGETNSEFGSWATDSRSQTNFVKTSETLNLKKIQQHSNVLSTAVLSEGEALGLSPELCQDLIVLLSGPRVKTLSWDMDKDILIENCRSYMERTHGGTRALTTELKYLNLDPDSFMHLPEEEDEDESDIYYGIEKGYEHLVDLQEPEGIWEDAESDQERTESCYSTENETLILIPKGRRKGKVRRLSDSTDEETLDPLSDIAPKSKHRSHSSESNIKAAKECSKERSKERKQKEGQQRDYCNSVSKNKSKKDVEKTKSINENDPVTDEVVKLLQKPKKERKKREKKNKVDLQKEIRTHISISRVICNKAIKTNMLNTHEQIPKREKETDLCNQIFISDSDYDSQGKSSITSVHTEGNDPDVLFDGLFSMDDMKSPEKSTAIATNKPCTLKFDEDNTLKRKSLVDNAVTAAPNLKTNSMSYVQYAVKDKELSKLLETPSSVSNVNEMSVFPSWCNSNPCKNETTDEVKVGIKRLIEFRKQKSATDLVNEIKHESENLVGLYQRKNCSVNKKFVNRFGLANTTQNESQILPGSPKAISVPDIPKVFINKKQSQQLSHLKNEVDNYLSNQGNNMESQSYSLLSRQKPEVRLNNEQSGPKSVKSMTTCTYSNKSEQKFFQTFNESVSTKVASNLPNTSVFKEFTSETKHNTNERNVSVPDQNKLYDFIKELHRSNNAGVCKDNRRPSELKKDTKSLFSAIPRNNCAKQIKPPKKVENAPNTFARLKYMHKNKQGDNLSNQNNDQLTQNESHTHTESVKVKPDIFDTLISRVDCTVIRTVEKTPQKKCNSTKEYPHSIGFDNVNKTVIKKVRPDDRLVVSNSMQSQTNLASVPTPAPTQSTVSAIAKQTVLVNGNEDNLRHIQRQKSKRVTSPQVRSDTVINKVTNAQHSSSALPLNSQNISQQLGNDICDRLQGCPKTIQPYQNVPGQVQNAITVQPKSSSGTKVKDKSIKNNIRHKPAGANIKESNIRTKSESKNKIVQQDWESVLNDLLSHKTPARGSNAQGMIYKKDKKPVSSNNLYGQKNNYKNSCSNLNHNISVSSRKQSKDSNTHTAMEQNKHSVAQKSRSTVGTSTVSVMNNIKPVNHKPIYKSSNASSILNSPLTVKSNDQSSLRKSNQTMPIKKLGKTSEVKLSSKKDSIITGAQTHSDPFISSVPSSEYDILAELMDDDLRQELCELSSDEDNFSTSNVITKGKVKGLSNKLINQVGCPISPCNFNNVQNQCSANNQTSHILQSRTKVPDVQVTPMPTSCETKNVIESKLSHNNMFINDTGKCQARMQEAKTSNSIHQTSIVSSNMQHHQGQQPLNNNNDSRISNINVLENNLQQSGISCSNPNIANDNACVMTSVNQINGNVFNAVPQQHSAVKNVLLLRPEIVYEPYSVQVHKVPETINPSISNLNTNTFVAVNAVPTISMFGSQFTNPVINPLIITKTITVPITKNTTSLVVNTINSNSTYCNTQLHTTNGVNNTKAEMRPCFVESKQRNNGYDVRNTTKNTLKPELYSTGESNARIDDLVNQIPRTRGEMNDSPSRYNSQGTLIETQLGNVKKPEDPTFVVSRYCNELDRNKVQDMTKGSTSHILLLKGQHTMKDEVVTYYPETNNTMANGCMLNKSCEKKVFSKLQEKPDLTTSRNTSNVLNSIDPENTFSKCEYASNSFSFNKVQNVQSATKISISNSSSERCMVVDDVVKQSPKTDIKVNDCVLNRNYERKMVSNKQEELNLTSSCYTRSTINSRDTEKPLECGHPNDIFSGNKVEDVSGHSFSHSLRAHCATVDKVDTVDYLTPHSKSAAKVNDCMVNKIFDKKILSKAKKSLDLSSLYYHNSMEPVKRYRECGNHRDNVVSDKSQVLSNDIISNPINGRCATVDVIDTPGSNITKLNDCILSEKSNETVMPLKVQESTVPCYSLGDVKNRSNSTHKIQKPTSKSDFYFSPVKRSKLINHIPKTDTLLNESCSNKTSERKVLSEVQENQTVFPPEKTILKTCIGTEDEIKKEFLKTREERIARKKAAILNRQVHIYCNVEPIPLTYAPINSFKLVPDTIKTHTTNKTSIDFVHNTKTQMLTVFDDDTIINENVSKVLTLDKIDNDIGMLHNKNDNHFQSVLIDGSKENNERNTTDVIRVQFQVCNKEADNLSKLPKNEQFDNNHIKTKLSLEVPNVKDGPNINKFKRTKGSKKIGRKTQTNKQADIEVAKEIIDQNSVPPVSTQNFDVEEQLQRSVISKKDRISKTVYMLEDVNCNKDNIQNDITLREVIDTYSICDQNYTNSINDKNDCHKEVIVQPMPDVKFTPVETKIQNRNIENTNAKHFKVVQPFVKPIVPNNPDKFGAQILDEVIVLNDDDLNSSRIDEIIINTKQSSKNELLSSVSPHQAPHNVTTSENDDSMSIVSKRKKSRLETLDHNKLIDSFKDNIIIEELPRKKDDDPLKRCISIKLANGNNFKATVSGKLQVDINSLFEDPAIRSVLMNNIPTNTRCVLNIQQVVSSSGENVKTRIIQPNQRVRNLETINLISDDEEDTVSQIFNTEFGKYKIRDLNDIFFNDHQKRFSQRCSVKIQKCNVPDNKSKDLLEKNIEAKDSMMPENIKFLEVGNLNKDKNVQIIEIDDSSNDSIDTNKKSIDVGAQPLRISNNMDLNINELKETILKDLGVDMNQKTVDTDIKPLSVPANGLENLKETLKDLPSELGNIEQERIHNRQTNVIANIDSDLKHVFRNVLSESVTNSDIQSTESTNKSCEHFSKIKQVLNVNFARPESILTLKAAQDVGSMCVLTEVPTVKNKLSLSKRCQLKIEKCDDLVKKYQLMKSKRCFVSLERCDRFISSEIGKQTEIIKPDTGNRHSQDALKLKNSETLCVTELDTSNCTLKRSGSFSILNEINLYDQYSKLLKPAECDINTRSIFDKCVTYNGPVRKNYENFQTCQSDWFMTKLKFHCMIKQIQRNSVIPDDISTDCDSDHDDNCSNLFDTLDGIERPELITYEVPSLFQVTLKFLKSRTVLLNNTKSLENRSSLHHLKRKLSVSDNTLNECKIMKFDDGNIYQVPHKQPVNIKFKEQITVTSIDMIQENDEFSKQQRYNNELQYRSTPDTNTQHNIQEIFISPLSSNLPSYPPKIEKMNLNNQFLKENLGIEDTSHINNNSNKTDKYHLNDNLILIEEETAINVETDKLSDNILKQKNVLKEKSSISSIETNVGDHIWEENNLEHTNTVPVGQIADIGLSKKDDTKVTMQHIDKDVLNEIKCFSREITGEETELISECDNIQKMNVNVCVSDEVNIKCEKLRSNINSEFDNNVRQGEIQSSKDIDKPDVTNVTVSDKKQYVNIKQTKYNTDSRSDIITEINAPLFKEFQDQWLSRNDPEIFMEYGCNNSKKDLTILDKITEMGQNILDSSVSMQDLGHVTKNYKSSDKITTMCVKSTVFDLNHVDKDNLNNSVSSKTLSAMSTIELNSNSNSEEYENLSTSYNTKLDESSTLSNNHFETASDRNLREQTNSIQLLRHVQHSSGNTNDINEERQNEILKLNDNVKSDLFASIDIKSDLTLSTDKFKVKSESNFFKQQNCDEKLSDIIPTKQNNAINSKNIQRVKPVNENETLTISNLNMDCDTKVRGCNKFNGNILKSENTYKTVPEGIEQSINVKMKYINVKIQETDQVVMKNNNVTLTSSTSSISNAEFEGHTDNIEHHTNTLKLNINSTIDINGCEVDRKDFNDEMRPLDMEYIALDPHQRLEKEPEENLVLKISDPNTRFRMESFQRHKSDHQCLHNTKNKKEQDGNSKDLTLTKSVVSGKLNTEVLEQSNCEFHGLLKFEEPFLGITYGTKIINENSQGLNDKLDIDVNSVKTDKNKVKEEHKQSCNLTFNNNEMDTKSVTENLDKTGSLESCNGILKFKQPTSLVSCNFGGDFLKSERHVMSVNEATIMSKNPRMNQVIINDNNGVSSTLFNSHTGSKTSNSDCTAEFDEVINKSHSEIATGKRHDLVNCTNKRELLENLATIDMNSVFSHLNKDVTNNEILIQQDISDCTRKNRDSLKCISKPSYRQVHNINELDYGKDNKTIHDVENKIIRQGLGVSLKDLDDTLNSQISQVKNVNNDNHISIRTNNDVSVTDSFEHDGKQKSITTESCIKIDVASYGVHKDVLKPEFDEVPCPKNITLLYQSDSKVILKGSILEDPIVGTCYVFPITKSEIMVPTLNSNNDYIKCDKTVIPHPCSNLLQETDLIVTKPKATYSKTDLKSNNDPRISAFNDKTSRRNLKRKIDSVDSKKIQKKYRNGKNIDYPKITVAAVCDFAYSKEFKNLTNYCNSIKFSYTKQYHLIQLDDVHTMLKNWPIEESNLPALDSSDVESDLFVDIDKNSLLPDPTKQTLAEEILTIYDDKEFSYPVINETNFSMGFGEWSGRVDQNLIDGKKSRHISAVTLSDVKQFQPLLRSVDKSDVYEIPDSREKHLRILDKYYSCIKLKDQVRSFFRKSTAELNYNLLKLSFEPEKRKSNSNDLFDTLTNFPFDLNFPDFMEPPIIENIVQVVQVTQLPVNTGAQNPVTCDPRVTQVSASPPQCSIENVEHDDVQPTIKTEYTELTTADIPLPLMPDYDPHHQEVTSAPPSENLPVCNDNITIETEVKIEVLEEVPENMDDSGRYDSKDFPTFSSDQITNTEYTFDVNDIKVPIKTEEPDVKIVFEPTENNVNNNDTPETHEQQQPQQKAKPQKPDQLAHAMNAAGITSESLSDSAIDLSNSLTRSECSEIDDNNSQRSNITAMTLQHALAQILPKSLNQTSESENNSQPSVASQILHVVQGNNASLNQITLNDNAQQSVISTATPTPVLHIVQSKNGQTSSSSNSSPVHNSNSYSGLSLVDAGLSQGGNQLLHIVNTGNPKPNNTSQLLKRVNLLTNLTNAQGSNEQKMVQFVCKSTDSKGIQLNTHQRSMVLRLHTIESPQSAPSKPECQDQSSTESPTKESKAPQELKSRSVYEENYAKFIQNSNKQARDLEKSTSLPKFNQAFGKPVFQDENRKSNEIETTNAHLPSNVNNVQNNCQSTDNSLHLDNSRQNASPPLLLRKSSTQNAAQQNLVQQIKQAITPMNIQTMHGGVIYTRQIPVNIGGGQTINLITVPSTERMDDSAQKPKPDVKYSSRSDLEPSIIKIVPQNPVCSNSETTAEESNNSGGVSSDNAHNSQPPPMLTQMRIKLPMLSKNPQMVSAARVVRPSFFQIQRNVIGGPNQPVYQQLVLTAAPSLGQQSIRLPHTQSSREMKVGTESQTSPESQMSSSTLEQLREFDMVLEQVKERSTVQPSSTSTQDFAKSHTLTTETSESVTRSTPSEVTQQVLYSIGNTQSVNVAYVNRKSTVVSTSASTSFARSPDSSGIVESPTSSSHSSSTHPTHTVTSETTNGTQPSQNHHKSSKVSSKSKSRPKSHHPQFKINSLPPKPSNQKPMEDEQTTQRILYILAEYKEQVENSPDKDKPAPRRRTNLQACVTPPCGSKRKKSSSCSRRGGRDSSPLDDNCRTMGSEDSSCGTSQGDCNETCQDLHSPQSSPRKVAKKLSFDQDLPATQLRSQPQQTQPQPSQSQLHKPQPQLQRNVLVTDGPTIAVTRAAPGKPATAVLMPANYILPVSMVKNGQQIAIVTNRGPKILTVGGNGEGGATNALLLQRLISPAGLKPMLARPGVRHVRLPTTALHNLQAFNLATSTSSHQSTEAATSPMPATSPPELIDTKAPRSPWTSKNSEDKPKQDTTSENQEQVQEARPEQPVRESVSAVPVPDPDPEPWNVPHDYSYEETVRTEMDRTVLDAIPDRYSPDMEAQRIFDKMFDVESKKSYIDSQDDSPHCPYDIDASDCDDKAYHQVVQRRDGVTNRHRFVSATTLRQKFALMEDELRLQKSLSEECEDLGVDSPSASDLFPEAELLFSSSPAHEVSHQAHTPQPVILNQSNSNVKSDVDDQGAADQPVTREERRGDKPSDEIDLGLEDVGIVTVSEDGMRATISLDHEEFVRSHPNTTFHSELTEEGEVQRVTLADLKARHITSTIFHAGRAPATVLVTAPQTTVISQATPDGAGVDHVRCSHASNLRQDVSRFDVMNESRQHPNATSAIIHSTGNTTQVIRRVCYERESRYFLDDDLMSDPKMADDDDRSSPERPELFWENSRRRQNRRINFIGDTEKCCKFPYKEKKSAATNVGVNMRLDSVIKDARGIDRSDMTVDDTNVPPLRTYPPKRTYHHEGHRNPSGRAKTEGGRFADSSESKRRASNRGVVKRGCQCCIGAPAPPKPKKPRHKKPTLDIN